MKILKSRSRVSYECVIKHLFWC